MAEQQTTQPIPVQTPEGIIYAQFPEDATDDEIGAAVSGILPDPRKEERALDNLSQQYGDFIRKRWSTTPNEPEKSGFLWDLPPIEDLPKPTEEQTAGSIDSVLNASLDAVNPIAAFGTLLGRNAANALGKNIRQLDDKYAGAVQSTFEEIATKLGKTTSTKDILDPNALSNVSFLEEGRIMEEAQKMIQQKVANDGIVVGADLKPRMWLSDDAMEVSVGKLDQAMWLAARPGHKITGTVGDFVKHDELFEAYPHLKDIPLTFEKSAGTIGGSYRPPIDGKPASINVETLSPKFAESTIIHELQHAIQNAEGFTRGANAANMKYLMQESVLRNFDSTNFLDELFDFLGKSGIAHNTAGANKLMNSLDMPKAIDTAAKNTKKDKLLEMFLNRSLDKHGFWAKDGPMSKEGIIKIKSLQDLAHHIYMTNAGEAEARAVQGAFNKLLSAEDASAAIVGRKTIFRGKRGEEIPVDAAGTISRPIGGLYETLNNL